MNYAEILVRLMAGETLDLPEHVLDQTHRTDHGVCEDFFEWVYQGSALFWNIKKRRHDKGAIVWIDMKNNFCCPLCTEPISEMKNRIINKMDTKEMIGEITQNQNDKKREG